MKKILLYTFAIFMLLVSCEKDEIMTFDSNNSGVVFPGLGDAATYKGYNNTDRTYHINESFLNIPLSQDVLIVEFPVRVSGNAVDRDREVAFDLIDSLTTATPSQYKIIESLIPAGERYGHIKFELYRDPELDDKSVTVAMILKDSKDLKVGSNEYMKGTLTWTNMLARFPNSGNFNRTYNCIVLTPLGKISTLGTYYSPNAHKAILDALEWPVGYWPSFTNGLLDPNSAVSTMFGAYYTDLYAQKLNAYLDAYAEANGGERLRHNAGVDEGKPIQARVSGAVYNPNL